MQSWCLAEGLARIRAVRPGRIAAFTLLVGATASSLALDKKSGDDLDRLLIPVEGVAPSDLHDTFTSDRAGHRHEAIDIAAARGTRVRAVADGRLVKLFSSVPGGLTIYQFDSSGRFAYYYAHLDRYADGLKEGMPIHRGDLLGYVGTTGNAPPNAPHLHFAVFRLAADHKWWRGEAVNPFDALHAP